MTSTTGNVDWQLTVTTQTNGERSINITPLREGEKLNLTLLNIELGSIMSHVAHKLAALIPQSEVFSEFCEASEAMNRFAQKRNEEIKQIPPELLEKHGVLSPVKP